MQSHNGHALSQSEYLTILTHAPAEAVKEMAETVIPQLGEVRVLVNRTGLVMLPYTDTSNGTLFHLGEILVSEAHVQIADGVQGYAICTGRDLEQSLAVALLDAALTAGIMRDHIMAFVFQQALAQAEADTVLLRAVEATRVEMETF
jgi:alpha-D-ribose 1-methylphosphonate 5-triphosphate synthase subunit PhnG